MRLDRGTGRTILYIEQKNGAVMQHQLIKIYFKPLKKGERKLSIKSNDSRHSAQVSLSNYEKAHFINEALTLSDKNNSKEHSLQTM